jgi:hypothetical protein
VRVAVAGGGGCVGDSVAWRFDVIMLPDSRCGYGRCDRAVREVHASRGGCAPQSSAQDRRRRQVYPQLDSTEHSSLGQLAWGHGLQKL